MRHVAPGSAVAPLTAHEDAWLLPRGSGGPVDVVRNRISGVLSAGAAHHAAALGEEKNNVAAQLQSLP